MWGAIIGDIVGSRFEHRNYRRKDFAFFSTRSFFTDDTLMTLAVAKALCKCGHAQDIALYNETIRCIRAMGTKYPDAGWGLSFARWLKAETPQPYQSFGNGAAMRVSPVGEYSRSEEEVRRLSRIVTSVSHDHPEGLKGAECMALCVYFAKNGRSFSALKMNTIRKFLRFPVMSFRDRIRLTKAVRIRCHRRSPVFSRERTLKIPSAMRFL